MTQKSMTSICQQIKTVAHDGVANDGLIRLRANLRDRRRMGLRACALAAKGRLGISRSRGKGVAGRSPRIAHGRASLAMSRLHRGSWTRSDLLGSGRGPAPA